MAVRDVRWIQRFESFKKALVQLDEAVALKEQRELTKLEKQGMIKAFECSHELAWNTLKDFLQSRGNIDIFGSRDATRETFKSNLIDDGDVWMEMIQSRSLTTYTYNEGTADEMVRHVHRSYFSQLINLRNKLADLAERQRSQTDE